MKKINILIVIRWPVGGIRTFIRYVYRNFDTNKYKLSILAPNIPELHVLLDDLYSFELFYIPIKKAPSLIEFFLAVSRVITTNKFDLIHSHGFTAGACSIFSVLTSTPHIMTSHDIFNANQFSGIRGNFRKIALSLALRMVDTIHCVSHDAEVNFLKHLPRIKGLKKRIITIPNGIEVERFLSLERRDLRKEFNLGSNTYLIGFLGRFMSQKGFSYLLDGLEWLLENESLPQKPMILTFSQEDGFIREEKQAVSRRHLQNSVLFLPFTADIASTLKGLDVVVMPSLWEACGLLAMEAMVSGVPLIGSDCMGLREILANSPASVVPARDSRSLASAIFKEMKRSSINKCRAYVGTAAKRFDVKYQARDLEELFAKVINK